MPAEKVFVLHQDQLNEVIKTEKQVGSVWKTFPIRNFFPKVRHYQESFSLRVQLLFLHPFEPVFYLLTLASEFSI